MGTYTSYTDGLSTASDNSPSAPQLVHKLPLIPSLENPGRGLWFGDDFAYFITGDKWTATQATAGTATIKGTETGGVLELDSNSTTADQGMQAQGNGAAFIPVAKSKIYFEARIKMDEATDAQTFIGLAITDTTVFAAGANTTANHIGFEQNALTLAGTVGTAGTLNFYGEKAGTRNTAAANVGLDVQAITDDQWYNVGFVIDGITNCKVYVNGIHTGDIIPTANIPIVGLTPTFVCQSEGTQDPILDVDWVHVFQTRTDLLD